MVDSSPPPASSLQEEAEAPTPLEEIFDALEAIVAQLEAGEQPLEEALGLFARGIQLCREGTQRLDATEAAIEELLRGGDGHDVVAARAKK